MRRLRAIGANAEGAIAQEGRTLSLGLTLDLTLTLDPTLALTRTLALTLTPDPDPDPNQEDLWRGMRNAQMQVSKSVKLIGRTSVQCENADRTYDVSSEQGE